MIQIKKTNESHQKTLLERLKKEISELFSDADKIITSKQDIIKGLDQFMIIHKTRPYKKSKVIRNGIFFNESYAYSSFNDKCCTASLRKIVGQKNNSKFYEEKKPALNIFNELLIESGEETHDDVVFYLKSMSYELEYTKKSLLAPNTEEEIFENLFSKIENPNGTFFYSSTECVFGDSIKTNDPSVDKSHSKNIVDLLIGYINSKKNSADAQTLKKYVSWLSAVRKSCDVGRLEDAVKPIKKLIRDLKLALPKNTEKSEKINDIITAKKI